MKPLLSMSKLDTRFGEIQPWVSGEDICKECDSPMSTPGHYRTKLRCVLCSYATCCSAMIPRHNSAFHPPNSKR